MDERLPPDVEVIRDDRGYYWRPVRDEARRSDYYATREEAHQAAQRWRERERQRWSQR